MKLNDFQYRNTYSLLVSAMKRYDLMDAAMPNRWMTLQEVAEYLQLSKDMIYRLAQTGRIPAPKAELDGTSDESGLTV